MQDKGKWNILANFAHFHQTGYVCLQLYTSETQKVYVSLFQTNKYVGYLALCIVSCHTRTASPAIQKYNTLASL